MLVEFVPTFTLKDVFTPSEDSQGELNSSSISSETTKKTANFTV